MMTGGTPNFGNLHILPVKHMWFSMILKNHLTIKEVMLAYGTLQAWGRYIWKTVQYVGDLGYHQHLAGKYLTSSIFTKFVQPTDLTGLLKTCSCHNAYLAYLEEIPNEPLKVSDPPVASHAPGRRTPFCDGPI